MSDQFDLFSTPQTEKKPQLAVKPMPAPIQQPAKAPDPPPTAYSGPLRPYQWVKEGQETTLYHL